ncbi:MAG: hypothetical protein WAT19_12830 [Ferruginibacter sp.]
MKRYTVLIAAALLVLFSACKTKKNKQVGDPITAEEAKEIYLDSTEQSCKGAVLRLVLSSSKVRSLTLAVDETVKKNGGTGHGFILDASPNPDADGSEEKSENYSFSVHEIYPEMHPPVAQFIYSPAKKELYQFDALHNKNVLIDHDASLEPMLQNACK